MSAVPSQEQVMGQLRILIPCVATAVTAFGVSSTAANSYAQMAMASIAPLSYVVCAIWGLVANSRAGIMAAAAKPVDASTPAPQIILPSQERALADKLPGNVTSVPGPGPNVVSIDANKVVKILLIAFLPLALLAGSGSAKAAPLKKFQPAVTGDPVADAKTDLTNLGLIPATGVTKNSDGTVTCNFNIFANLNPKNLVATINACISDANSTFEPDVSAALASAQAYSGSGDQTGIQCLQPALAIVQAGIQRPAVDAMAAQPANGNIPAVAAAAAVPAYKPGAITLFQKFREFTLAGGPTACQNWVNGTIQGAVSPVVGAVAGAAALGGL